MKTKYRCSRCREEKEESYFYSTSRSNHREGWRPVRAHCKECMSVSRNWKRRIVKRYKELFGCSRCGYDSHGAALHFHHVRDKKFTVGDRVNNNSFRTLLPEIDKCIILCANCHAVEHYNDDH